MFHWRFACAGGLAPAAGRNDAAIEASPVDDEVAPAFAAARVDGVSVALLTLSESETSVPSRLAVPSAEALQAAREELRAAEKAYRHYVLEVKEFSKLSFLDRANVIEK